MSIRKPAKSALPAAAAAAATPEPRTRSSFPIVGIGASAGGLEAFTQLLRALPTDTGMGFVLLQHLDPDHESALVQILSRATSLQVREIKDHVRVEPNHVYVIPRDTNLTISKGTLKLHPRDRARVPNRPIDTFFESLAEDQREWAIGIVLSGTATDGTLGLEAIKAEGGITFAQDDSARHDSMPRCAIAAGCVDMVLSPSEISLELKRISMHPAVAGGLVDLPDSDLTEGGRLNPNLPRPGAENRSVRDHQRAIESQDDDSALPSGGSGSPDTGGAKARRELERASQQSAHQPAERAGAGEKDARDGYKKILLLLRNHCGVDFSFYKSTTIQRRITRRMVVTKHDTAASYAAFLRDSSQELDSLFSDVLISVTSFFRNPEAFDALQREVFPKLLAQPGNDPIRCWVLGCSTGQEAYSIAMAFTELAAKATRARKLQIFATDLNDKLLDKARSGLYTATLAQDISPERLHRFFVEEDGGYRVIKELREMVVFARQNLIADPPFSRMDLISCRNLLIYLEPSLQKRAMPTFHYALKPGGFLLLGASESVGEFTGLFGTVDRKHKIFSKKVAQTPAFHLPALREDVLKAGASVTTGRRPPSLPIRQRVENESLESLRGELNAQREADRIAVNQFAPPSVLVNADLQVMQFRGPTGAYLEPPTGKATFDVLKMAREGLMHPLRSAIDRAKKEGKIARAESVRVKRDGETRAISLQVIPLKNLPERSFLIVFEEEGENRGPSSTLPSSDGPKSPPLTGEQEASRIAELESDLFEMREYLQSLQEQHEAANEELQAANEEIQSANEELQSINEELETSKEELESANEELTTVNEEMANRNADLNRLNDDLLNLQTSTGQAIILLGRDLTIRRFSPRAAAQFDLLVSDVGRPIGHMRHGLADASDDPEPSPGKPTDLESIASEVISSVREQEHEALHKDGRWYSLRVRPYLTRDNKVDGAVLVLSDIDLLKRSEQESNSTQESLRKSHADLQQHAEELTRFNTVAVGRELRMIELKREINALCLQSNVPTRYSLAAQPNEKGEAP